MPAPRYQIFSSLPYQRIDIKDLSEQFRRARLRMRLAMKKETAIQAIRDAQQIMVSYASTSSLARIRHDQAVDDSFYQQELAFYDQQDPQVEQMIQAFYQALSASRFRRELEQDLGPRVFDLAVYMRETIQPQVVQDMSREKELASQYVQLLAEASIGINGREYSLSQLQPLLESSDRQVRKLVWQARGNWYQEQGEQLDQIFNQLVRLRTRIARKLGFDNFIPVGYRRMMRFDYGEDEVAGLRERVKNYIVPLTGEIRRLQRKRLGLDSLKAYDLPCLFDHGNPRPVRPLAEWPGVASQILADLSGQRPDVLSEMISSGYIDWQARPRKAAGAYCQTLYQPGLPFILMNGTGTAQDIFTLMHEAGHAYASYRSLPEMVLIDQHMPALDVCEIHSTALEYLSYPYLERFFADASEQVSMMHMTEALLFLPYGCLVDEFQHRIYEQPDMSSQERHQLWRELEQVYQPDLEYGDEPFYEKGGSWQMKGHIYTDPFYYIDYVLAQLASLDLWQMAGLDLGEAFRCYDQLCLAGGSRHFSRLLEQTGLASPFDPGTIKRLAYRVCDFLSL